MNEEVFLLSEDAENGHSFNNSQSSAYGTNPNPQISIDVSDKVCEQDFLEVACEMPVEEGKWKQILMKCFGIGGNDIYKAEYACRGEGLESIITKALVDWWHRQPSPLTKQQLQNILTSAQRKGICRDSSWCDFLVPGSAIGIEDTEFSRQPVVISPVQGFMIREFSNPLNWHMMISCLAFHLFYSNIHMKGLDVEVFVLPLLISGDYIGVIPFERYLTNIMGNDQHRALPLNITGYLVTILFVVDAFVYGNTLEGYFHSNFTNFLFIVFMTGQNCKARKKLSFNFFSDEQIEAAYTQYPKQSNKFHTLLNVVTWPIMGRLLGRLVYLVSDYKIFVDKKPPNHLSFCETQSVIFFTESVVAEKIIPMILVSLSFLIWSLTKYNKPVTCKTIMQCLSQIIVAIISMSGQVHGIWFLTVFFYTSALPMGFPP